MRSAPPHTMYGPQYYTQHMGSMDVRGSYWENLMSSRYAVELQRIYGVPGSEYVGYFPTDLNIGNPNAPPMLRSPNGHLCLGPQMVHLCMGTGFLLKFLLQLHQRRCSTLLTLLVRRIHPIQPITELANMLRKVSIVFFYLLEHIFPFSWSS